MSLEFIVPSWSAPEHVKCVSTTRRNGFSTAPYRSFNLGGHTKEPIEHVNKNRALLQQQLQLPNDPVWLDQMHGVKVLRLDRLLKSNDKADAACTNKAGVVCAVLTADCLPVVFCDQKGKHVAVAHAGWRGLLGGVLENTLQALPVSNREVLCWLGPAIGPNQFEVGEEVSRQFVAKDAIHENAFSMQENQKYLADIYQLARNVLSRQHIKGIYGGDHCTFSEKETFYSYRRDGETGRMATLIWMQNIVNT